MLEVVVLGGNWEEENQVTSYHHLPGLTLTDFVYSLILLVTFPLKIFFLLPQRLLMIYTTL